MENTNTQKPTEKKSIFSKWWFWVIVVILLIAIVGALILFTLFKKGKDFITNNDLAESIIEQSEDNEEQESKSDTSETSSDTEYVAWESLDIPDIFPKYTQGDIEKPYLFTWSNMGIPNILGVYNTTREDIENYVESAASEGWEILWEDQVMGDEDSSWALSLDDNGYTYSILLNWYGETEDYLSLVLGQTAVE